jgi:hypothetical protein
MCCFVSNTGRSKNHGEYFSCQYVAYSIQGTQVQVHLQSISNLCPFESLPSLYLSQESLPPPNINSNARCFPCATQCIINHFIHAVKPKVIPRNSTHHQHQHCGYQKQHPGWGHAASSSIIRYHTRIIASDVRVSSILVCVSLRLESITLLEASNTWSRAAKLHA